MTDTDLDPLAQQQAEQWILRLNHDLVDVTMAVADASERAARAEHAYKLAYAKAIFRATGRVADKEAEATINTEQELLEHKLADAILRANQEKGRNIRAQLDALRSINANIRPIVTGR